MPYMENPKTKGSGIVCAIPQKGRCLQECPDCFFQSGRSYLEPLDENLPNVPSIRQSEGQVVRMNDGNDSNHQRDLVLDCAAQYDDVFFNTSYPNDLEEYPGPVVLTVNPRGMTDIQAFMLDPIPFNLMFVRFRANMWNFELLCAVVEHYAAAEVPVVVTFMAYCNEKIPKRFAYHYEYRQRTMNSYWVIKQTAWDAVMKPFADNEFVYSCGKDAKTHACKYCGVCLTAYYSAKRWMKGK